MEQQQQEKRPVGRPRKSINTKRQHVDIMLSPEAIRFIDSQPMSRGQFIERLIEQYRQSAAAPS